MIRRRLNDAGLFGRRPVKEPYISDRNRAARVAWARAHLNWTQSDSHGVEPLHSIRGNMDRFVYEQMLQNVMLPVARASTRLRYPFHQDNDPKQTSNHIKTAWAQVPLYVLTYLIQSMPRRCQAVIDSRGFGTEY
uniref:HTH_Tnp_Tc3_2 domain-containing protein n=3 Tax=Caenorhabditis japonica TaxID=281687 RepID=A0A8R1E8A8_CAEJA